MTPPRQILLNPGPVNVTARVRRALQKADICHREEEFSNLLKQTRQKMLKLFGIEKTHTLAFFTGSGTAALEAMLGAFDGKILVLSNGVYGERMKTILEFLGRSADVLSAEIGGFPDLNSIETLLKNDNTIKGIAFVHHETSSGMLNPLPKVAALAEKYKKTILVDAISSLGGEKIDFKQHSIGFLAGVSGKCLHAFPGISFVIVSHEEAAKLGHKKPASLYLDLAQALKTQAHGGTPFTPAVQLFYAFYEALEELTDETVKKRIAAYAQKSALLEEGFQKLGLHFMIEKEKRSHVLTALWLPTGLSYEKLHDALKKTGFVIYAGQSKFKDKIFRISNLGDIRTADIRRFLSSLAKILKAR